MVAGGYTSHVIHNTGILAAIFTQAILGGGHVIPETYIHFPVLLNIYSISIYRVLILETYIYILIILKSYCISVYWVLAMLFLKHKSMP